MDNKLINSDELELDEKIVDIIVDVIPILHEKFIRAFEHNAKSMFTQLQLRCLLVLIHGEPLPMNKLAAKLDMSKQQLTRFVDTLVQRGMLRRFNLENDRRTIYIDITKKGRECALQHSMEMREANAKSVEKLSYEEKEEFYEAMKICGEMFRKCWE